MDLDSPIYIYICIYLYIYSPLGLRLGIGDEGAKERDADWLSSLEMVVAPYADVFTMQACTYSHWARGTMHSMHSMHTPCPPQLPLALQNWSHVRSP